MTKKTRSQKSATRNNKSRKAKAARRPTKASTRTERSSTAEAHEPDLHQLLVVEICAAATSTVLQIDAGEPHTSAAMMVAANVLLEMARQALGRVPDDLIADLERVSREEAL